MDDWNEVKMVQFIALWDIITNETCFSSRALNACNGRPSYTQFLPIGHQQMA